MITPCVALALLFSVPAPPTLTVRTIPVKGQPNALYVHQDKLFVSCFHGSNLAVVATATRTVDRHLFLDAYESGGNGTPRSVQRCPPGEVVVANGKLFVAQIFGDHLVVFDLKTLWPIKRLPLDGGGCFAATGDGNTVYFASATRNEFHIIDTRTYTVKTVTYPDGGRGIGCVALSGDGQRLYLGIQRGGKHPDGRPRSGGNAFLAVYNLPKATYLGTTYLAQTTPGTDASDDSVPYSLSFAPDGRQLYIGMFQSRAGIQIVDTTTLRLVDNIPFKANARNTTFSWVDPLSVAVAGRWLLAVNRNNNELVVVDRGTLKVVARLTFAEGKHQLQAMTVHNKRIYLGDNAAQAVHELNGRALSRLIARAMHSPGRTMPVEITLVSR